VSLSWILPTTTDPSSPAFAICRAGQESAFFYHLDTVSLVFIFTLQLVQRLPGTQQSNAAPGKDAFLDRGPGGMHGYCHVFGLRQAIVT
jgi:hypothetical protein